MDATEGLPDERSTVNRVTGRDAGAPVPTDLERALHDLADGYQAIAATLFDDDPDLRIER